jgi:uncharacterized membrane protein
MEIFEEYGIEFLARYAHVISGITWIGLLYYFNFVQTPAFAAFEAGPRTEAFAKLVPRAMWWFRWGAASTLAFGLLLFALGMGGDFAPFDEMKSIQTMSILAGMLFGIVMFSNVWMVIWPAQKRAIANAVNVQAGQPADEGLPPVMRKAACASRTNTLLSIPMLFFMLATSHFYPSGAFDSSEGGKRAIWYLVILAIAVIVEVIVVRAPAAGRPEAFYIDDHKNTIISGFALTLILYGLTEVLFG